MSGSATCPTSCAPSIGPPQCHREAFATRQEETAGSSKIGSPPTRLAPCRDSPERPTEIGVIVSLVFLAKAGIQGGQGCSGRPQDLRFPRQGIHTSPKF